MGLQCVLMGEVYLGLASIYSGPEIGSIYLTMGHKKTLVRGFNYYYIGLKFYLYTNTIII